MKTERIRELAEIAKYSDLVYYPNSGYTIKIEQGTTEKEILDFFQHGVKNPKIREFLSRKLEY